MRPATYQERSAITQARSATANTATSDSLPSTAKAPATTSVGIAGIGNPICSMNTLPKTIASPYALTREERSLLTGRFLRRLLLGPPHLGGQRSTTNELP